MRIEVFKRGMVSILLVFALMFSMISVAPLASSGDWVNEPAPGGTIIEVVPGDNFLIRHTLEWDEPQDGAYTVTMAWDCYDNEPSESFTFLGAEAYFDLNNDNLPDPGLDPILAVVYLASAPSPDYPGSTRYALSVSCPSDVKDSRNGQFNVDILMGAYGVGGVPHIPTDNHPIPFQFAGVIITESGLNFWNRAPITIRVLAKLISISPDYQGGPPERTLKYIVTVTNISESEDNFNLTVSDSKNWGPTLDDYRFENIPPGENGITILRVTVPAGAIIGTRDRITVTVISQSDPNVRDNVVVEAIAQMPGIVRGKDTAYNVNNTPPPPWKTYERGDIPPVMVAKRVGLGAAIAAGFAPACRDGHWNIPENPDPHLPELLHASFQWMVPGATTVLWYEGYGVYNNRGVCATLVEAVTDLGYTITGDSTEPITSSLLSPYDILVIPQMQLPYPPSLGYPSGNPDLLPDADVQAIKNWVEGGGGLLIMEATDFFDYKYSEVHNKVLLALGFDYLFQDDSVYDDTNNIAGATYRAIVDVDNTTEIGEVYQSLTGKTTIGLYGYCSLAKAGPGVSVRVVSDYQVGMPGTTLEYDVVVFNPYNPAAEDLTYDILVSENADWSLSVSPTSLFVPIGENRKATLSVTIPAGMPLSLEDVILVEAVARGYPEVRDSFTCFAHAGKRIEPTDDAYVSDEENDKTYGADNPLPLYTGRYGEFWQNAYLQFDLLTLPSGASITDARLYLFCYNVYGTQAPIACTEVDDDDWDELTITWNNKPEDGPILDQRLVRIGETGFPISYSWDVTPFVDQEFKGDKVVSLSLRGLEDHPISVNESFLSKDWPYESRVHPFLRISYTTEVVDYKVSVSISPNSRSGSPGETLNFTVTVRNEGTLDDSYSLTVTDTAGWSPSISPPTLTLDAGASDTVTLTVTIPSGAADGATDSITVTATSQENAEISDSASCIARVLCIPDIWVEPTSFDVTLPPGTSENYTLMIGNDGNAPLTYDITDVETIPTVSETRGYVRETYEFEIENADLSFGRLSNDSSSAVIHVKSSGIIDNLDILALGTSSLSLDDAEVARLNGLGANAVLVEDYEIGSLTLSDLEEYDVVYLPVGWGSSSYYIETIGDNIQTYVSNGGGLVVGQCSGFLAPYTPAFLPYSLTYTDSWYPGCGVTILDPHHYITSGLTGDNMPDVYDRIPVDSLDPSYDLLAKSSVENVLSLAVASYGSGRIAVHTSLWCGCGTFCGDDPDIIIERIFYWTSQGAPDCPWLDENPKSGTVEPGSSDEITISIDTTGLDLGDYSANIVIHNNDPDEDPKVVPVYLTVTVVSREWDASITATFSGGGDDAVFSVIPDATPGFDNAYDIPEPPPPVAPSYVRTFFYYPEQIPDELHRSSLAPEDLMEWPMRIEYVEGLEDITLTWNVEDVPVDYPIFLYRGENLVADMRAEDDYTFVASTGSYDFRIVVGRFVSFTLELAQGWNMISFPVLPENSSPDSIFDGYYVLYRWDAVNKRYVLHADSGSFVEPDPDVEAGVGYWAYVLEDENVDLLGVPVDQLTLSLRQGWNLIGPPYGGSSIADPADDPDNSVIPWAFTWNAGEKSYGMTQQLEAGKGYWVYATRDCELMLNVSNVLPTSPHYEAIGTVDYTIDGDTIQVNLTWVNPSTTGVHTGSGQRVRFSGGIDAPELANEGGQEAKSFVRDNFCSWGTEVFLDLDNLSDTPYHDTLGRLLGVVYVKKDGKWVNVNAELLRWGLEGYPDHNWLRYTYFPSEFDPYEWLEEDYPYVRG